jgi:UDP-N-acetylmuramoyl-L-alanyl-D-glutamate--2,6-diaminopimelate ligase
MRLLELCKKLQIKCPAALQDGEIRGITSNSQKVSEGFIFFCLEGTKRDGHHYAHEALMKGAIAVVIENERYECERSIRVVSTRAALARAMDVFCGEVSKKLKFIGITGTNGKTSTSMMLKHILDNADISCEVIGTLNCSSFSEKHETTSTNFTTPDPEELYPMLQRISDAGIGTVIMETSSHALKLRKLEPIRFEIGIFTNLTEDHLDFHGDMEDYFKSKCRLFDKCKLGIINIDDAFGMRITREVYCEKKTCSVLKDADFAVLGLDNLGEDGFEYEAEYGGERIRIKCRVPGEFSIMNSVQAAAAALTLGIDKNIIERSFESFFGVKGRLEKSELSRGRGFAVFIDYAHTPDALCKVLSTLKSFKKEGSRVVALFGCGGDREREKRALMGKIAVENADFAVITSDNPRSEDPTDIINDILHGCEGAQNFAVIPNRKDAIEYVIATHRVGDIILLAGKGHENYEIDARGAHYFDEREVLGKAIEKYCK